MTAPLIGFVAAAVAGMFAAWAVYDLTRGDLGMALLHGAIVGANGFCAAMIARGGRA